jgi:flagellum-specific peptidoglycan hydrolase FlgJ
MANFNMLQGIMPPQVIAQLPQQGGGEGDGIGELFEGLKGLAGGIMKHTGGSGEQGAVNASTPYSNPNTAGMQGPVQGLQQPQMQGPTSLQAPQMQDTRAIISKEMAKNLNPHMQEIMPKFMADLKAQGFEPMIASGYRSPQEQALKVKQGYSKTMNSQHVHGNALDIVDRRYGWNDKKYGNEIKSFASAMAQTAAKYGLTSGTKWKSFGPHGDFAHIELARNNQPQPMQSQQAAMQSPSMKPNNYITPAIQGAQKVYSDNPVMSQIAAAQAILESNLGNKPSGLAQQNNFFGIKGNGTAGSVNMGTKEFVNGRMINTKAGFAKNATPEDSFTQHRDLMQRDRYKAVREATTFEDAANALYRAGYATDPNYAKKLIKIRDQYLADPNGMKTTMNDSPELHNMPQVPINQSGEPNAASNMPTVDGIEEPTPNSQVAQKKGINWQLLQALMQQNQQG